MKRLDNRGWGEKDMLMLCGVIAIVLFVIYVLVNQFQSMLDDSSTHKSSSKSDISEKLKEATDKGMITDEVEPAIDNTASKKEAKDMNYYYSLEDKLVVAGRSYVLKNYEIKDDVVLHISLGKLVDGNYIGPVTDETGESCSGYVTYTSNTDKYEPYLHCGSLYITSDYEMQYEN